jgi:hypothetical protein
MKNLDEPNIGTPWTLTSTQILGTKLGYNLLTGVHELMIDY